MGPSTTDITSAAHARLLVILHIRSLHIWSRPSETRRGIGTWVAKRRTAYRRRSLSPARITQLESEFPDWQWNIRRFAD
jgi:hypothetical protein